MFEFTDRTWAILGSGILLLAFVAAVQLFVKDSSDIDQDKSQHVL